jgi:hypothetical protein
MLRNTSPIHQQKGIKWKAGRMGVGWFLGLVGFRRARELSREHAVPLRGCSGLKGLVSGSGLGRKGSREGEEREGMND